MKRRSEQGFTLIEITAVLILLAAFALLVGPTVLKSVDKGRANVARTQIASLKTVLNTYKLENGSYPTTDQGLAALYEKPTIPPIPENWDGPYLDDPIKNDPWNRPYVYICPGQHNKQSYDILSYGADGAEGGEGINADITNWTAGSQ
ncbi:MAG: type II secretion system major pseudopilin GspG [Bacteroidota bacterium]